MNDLQKIQHAYSRLDFIDRAALDTNVTALRQTVSGCGEQTALEILAALGRLLAQDEKRRQEKPVAK